MSTYVRGVIREMEHRAEQVAHRRVQTLFVGGGTPSLLPVSALERIFSAAGRCFTWTGDAEISLEANPDSVDSSDQVRAWRDLGVTRVSLGIQSLDPHVLSLLGRTHTPEQAASAVQCLKQAGLTNLSLDLIWGVPGQDLEGWLGTLRKVMAWDPAHLSLYSLTIEPGTPLAAQEAGHSRKICSGSSAEGAAPPLSQERRTAGPIQSDGQLKWPDEDTWADMFFQGRELLVQAGFEHYEISNYARAGRICRHNSGIWQGEEYMGFGPSAVSTLDGVRRQNPESLAQFFQMVDQGRPRPDEEALSRRVRQRERVMLGLRTSRGIDCLQDPSWMDKEMVEQLVQAGLMEVHNQRLRLTPGGMLVSNEILARMLA